MPHRIESARAAFTFAPATRRPQPPHRNRHGSDPRRQGRHHRNQRQCLPVAEVRQPPRPDRRGDRHRQDGHPDDPGRGLQPDRRAGLPGRREGRRGRAGGGGHGEREAAAAHRPDGHQRLPQRGRAGGVLGSLGQAGPSGTHHRQRDRPHPALAHPGVERNPGRRARHRVQAGRRPRPAVARPRRPARAARPDRRRAQGHQYLVWPGQHAVDRRDPARLVAPGAGRRRHVLRRAGAGAQ